MVEPFVRSGSRNRETRVFLHCSLRSHYDLRTLLVKAPKGWLSNPLLRKGLFHAANPLLMDLLGHLALFANLNGPHLIIGIVRIRDPTGLQRSLERVQVTPWDRLRALMRSLIRVLTKTRPKGQGKRQGQKDEEIETDSMQHTCSSAMERQNFNALTIVKRTFDTINRSF